MVSSPDSRRHLAGIFALSLALLSYQIVLTRVFSVVLFTHFAFFGISLAMLGLTIGAVRVFLDKPGFDRTAFASDWTKAALGFALSSVAIVVCFLYLPLFIPEAYRLKLAAVALMLFIVPFTYGGLCVALILTKSPSPVGKLYAADLLGAAIGCIGVAGLLFVLDPVTIILALAALAAAAGWLIARGASARLSARAGLLAAMFLTGTIVQGGLYLADQPHLGVVWSKIEFPTASLFERWNAISLVRVTPTTGIPFGWGFARPPQHTLEQYYLDIDHNAATSISRFDGDRTSLAFLADDVINFGYQIRPVHKAAVVGVGGGRDILSALYFGVEHITGIELNPSIFEILTRRFADFSGHLDRRPDVTLVPAEARSWLNETRQSFDLVQISLIDTWAATAAGGLAMTEDKLYTAEAWRDFMDRLDSTGMLVVSRWYEPETHPVEFYRLLSLAVQALKARGVPATEVRQHILAMSGGSISSVAISVDAFSPDEIARARALVETRGFVMLLDPDKAVDGVAATIADGRADPAFFASLPFDVTPPTDDRPFFFQTRRIGSVFTGGRTDYDIDGLSMSLLLLAMTFLALAYFVLIPLIRRAKDIPTAAAVPHLVYFSAIGLGFMLVEISQMQRLMIFLGHPIYGLTVVLFALLLFGGLGSSTIGRGGAAAPWSRPVLCCVVLALVGLLTPSLTEAGRSFGAPLRILLSIAVLAPPGFVMGMMFPIGMQLSTRQRELQPWFWGVNGAASVFASVTGVVISMIFGITTTFWCGFACYLVCIPIALAATRAPDSYGAAVAERATGD